MWKTQLCHIGAICSLCLHMSSVAKKIKVQLKECILSSDGLNDSRLYPISETNMARHHPLVGKATVVDWCSFTNIFIIHLHSISEFLGGCISGLMRCRLAGRSLGKGVLGDNGCSAALIKIVGSL